MSKSPLIGAIPEAYLWPNSMQDVYAFDPSMSQIDHQPQMPTAVVVADIVRTETECSGVQVEGLAQRYEYGFDEKGWIGREFLVYGKLPVRFVFFDYDQQGDYRQKVEQNYFGWLDLVSLQRTDDGSRFITIGKQVLEIQNQTFGSEDDVVIQTTSFNSENEPVVFASYHNGQLRFLRDHQSNFQMTYDEEDPDRLISINEHRRTSGGNYETSFAYPRDGLVVVEFNQNGVPQRRDTRYYDHHNRPVRIESSFPLAQAGLVAKIVEVTYEKIK